MKHLQQYSNTAAVNDSTAATILSKSFLDHGFCLSPLFDNTHFSCASFDFICACVCIVAIIVHKVGHNENTNKKKKKKSLVLPGSAIYFLSHSYGHYLQSVTYDNNNDDEQQQQSNVSERIQKAITLAFILSIGPLDAASVLIKSKKLAPKNAYLMAAIMLMVLVGIYEAFLYNPSYALLYINISIILSVTLPKLLFVGYTTQEDVTLRASDVVVVSKIVTGMIVMVVIVCEPFLCDAFFAKVGGHFLFDLSLALDVVASVMVEQRRGGVDEEEEDMKMKHS